MYKHEIKALKLLQDRSSEIAEAHSDIGSRIGSIKRRLAELGGSELMNSDDFQNRKDERLREMSREHPLESVALSEIYREAENRYSGPISLGDVLTAQDWKETEGRLDRRIADFNHRYSLDEWDYAIAGACGLFAAMLDLLCVGTPLKPRVGRGKVANGIFDQWVQKAFNKILPPELSDVLSKVYPIGAPDSSVTTNLLGAPAKALNPINHRLRSLAHDPILGFIFGLLDMMNGTCTIINDGRIRTFPSTKSTPGGNVFQLLGRMLGHLSSDVNAPSVTENRGMGLPAPFMGVLRMFEGIPVGDSNFGRQIEWMYVNGYDFRHFMATSVPSAIMEVLLRSFYVAKQMKLYGCPFGRTMLETMPLKMNPRFRMMLALAYGVSSAVNAGKVYITRNILTINYASWMGLVWNGFHALKWALLERQLKLWEEVEAREIEEIENLSNNLEQLSARAARLPI